MLNRAQHIRVRHFPCDVPSDRFWADKGSEATTRLLYPSLILQHWVHPAFKKSSVTAKTRCPKHYCDTSLNSSSGWHCQSSVHFLILCSFSMCWGWVIPMQGVEKDRHGRIPITCLQITLMCQWPLEFVKKSYHMQTPNSTLLHIALAFSSHSTLFLTSPRVIQHAPNSRLVIGPVCVWQTRNFLYKAAHLYSACLFYVTSTQTTYSGESPLLRQLTKREKKKIYHHLFTGANDNSTPLAVKDCQSFWCYQHHHCIRHKN